MSIKNLFIRSKRSLAGVQFDAVIREDHNNQIRITKNPVEFGADITDHAIIEPKTITIIAEVTDTPLFGLANIGAIIEPITSLFGSSTDSNETRSKAAYNTLVEFMETREPIEVQTKLKNYTDMLITNISTSQDKDTGKIVNLIISLEEVLITESEVVEISEDQLEPGTTAEQAESADKAGRKEVKEPSSSENKSIINKVRDWVSG